MNKKRSVLFYTKKECPLCDEAREMLYRFQGKFPLAIQEIDITTDSILYERYKNIIPVVIIDDKFTLGARIEEDELRSCLQRATRSALLSS